MYGKCKSNINQYQSIYKRFNCTECVNFDLCYKCLNGERVNLFSCLNHPHKFTKIDNSLDDWSCDGKNIYGKCCSKSGNKSLIGKIRFKCSKCKDFDFCAECLCWHIENDELDKEFSTLLHEHSFIKIKKSARNWSCDGKYLFGSCKSINNTRQSRFKCTQCRKFILCSDCFNFNL